MTPQPPKEAPSLPRPQNGRAYLFAFAAFRLRRRLVFLLRHLAGAVAAFAALPAAAREILPDEAGMAAAAWARRDGAPLGVAFASSGVSEVRTSSDDGGTPLFHVVRMADGGVVVTSAESGVTPVVAFLDGEGIDDSPGSPLWEILNADLSERMARVRAVRGEVAAPGRRSAAAKGNGSPSDAVDPFAAEEAAWAALLAEAQPARGTRKSAAIPDASSPSDLRVPALLSTKWDQNNGAANYYTPPNAAGNANNYVCGCVALAGAQIANFWRFPVDPRPQVTLPCYVDQTPTNCTTLGGTYDWANMPGDFYSTALTPAQKQAAGRLCYDFGVATQMDWGSDGSATAGFFLAEAFTDVFGYANAMSYFYRDGNAMPDDLVERAVLANLDAGCPVALGIADHMVVADGYGYASGTLYTHLNFGWSGLANAWYNLPDVADDYTGYTSTVLNEVVFNIFPTATGELLTGRVVDTNGNPVAGATVIATNLSSTVAGTTNARGIYALTVAGNTSWKVTAESGGLSGSCPVAVGLSSSAKGWRDATGSWVSDCGAIGNSWGNDITLDVDASGGGEGDPGEGGDQPSDPADGGYAAWAAANGLGAANAVTDGQPNLLRYVFDKPSGAFSPFTGISFHEGAPVIFLRPFANTDGVSVTILSTTNLLDWSRSVEYLLPDGFSGGGLIAPDSDPVRFYCLKVEGE